VFPGWSGSVRLAEGETFTVTPFNNASAVYTVNRTSALGALDAAAAAGNFNYTLKEESWGSALYSIGGIAYNETSWDSWLFMVDGVTAGVGAADYQLADGDVVTYWYGTWNSTPDTAGTVVNITVSIPATPTPTPGLWSGTVALTEGETFPVTPFNNESAVYTVNRTSALGALDAAATAGGFNYTLKEESWGSYLYSIAGIAYNETSWDSWLFMVDGVTAGVGAADYQLADGDVVTYWYGAWDSPPESAGAVVNITVSIPTTPTPTPGGEGGGGDSPASWITVTLEPGTFNVTAESSGKTYTVDRQTALGALDATGTAYTIDDSYYQEYGSLFLNSVRGRAGEGTKGWMYQVNGESPAVGANTYALANGDEVVFFWSEGMSSTPATSSDVISIRVVIPASSGDSGSSSSGDGSGVSGTTTSGSGEPGAAPSFFLGLPAGAAIELGEWGQVFSFDTGRGNSSAEQVTVSGNSFIIRRNGLTMVLAARNINEKDGTATGLIESVTASIEPVTANISSIGLVAASLDLNLTGIPGDGRIEISITETPDAGAASAFHLAAAENGEEIDALAYTMTVTRTNLENGEDIAGAVIRMTVSPTWVEEHGGVGAVRIARSAEDGTYELLDTRLIKTDGNGNLVFEAVSPGGLSVFGLLTVTAAPAAQALPTSTATAAVSDTPAATDASPSLSSPLIVVGVGAALLIGAAYVFIERRRKQ
jgi:frataxin-like iron-binding protein CyaY